MKTACVVGSGPSGAACAHGLIKRGVEVTLLDVGLQIESDIEDLTRNTEPVDVEVFLTRVRRKRKATAQTRSIPAKMPFGSDYAYRPIAQSRLQVDQGASLVSSLALGGLSRAWGANVCGLASRDCSDWPFEPAELDASFAELADLVEVAGSPDDDLNELYSAPLNQSESFPLGPQGRYVIACSSTNSSSLRQRGLHCGRAKLAIGARYATNGESCVSCGLCMHGCPYNAIFSGADVVRRLEGETGFRYLPRRFVTGFEEIPEGVSVRFEELDGGGSGELRTERLFLACGVLGTTALVARTLDLCDHTFTIKDSTKYLFPFVTDRRIRGSLREPANTLAQLFVQAVGQSSTSRTVHGQLYGYNDLILDPLRKLIGNLAYTFAPLAAPVLERVMIGMVYLHSQDSGVLKLQVDPEARGAGLGRVWGERSERSDLVFAEYMKTLVAARVELGGRPWHRLASKNPPGLSQHFGGSLPMSREPDRWSTDVLGRPWRCARTHCVDSSVLPSIPGTPTALILMANALRIATASVAL